MQRPAKTTCKTNQAFYAEINTNRFPPTIPELYTRTLYEENSRSFHVASYNRACFYLSFFLAQTSNSKQIALKWNLIHLSEFKTTPTFVLVSTRHTRIHPRGRYNPTSPIGAKRKRIQSYTSRIWRGIKNAKEYKICSVIDEYGRAHCAGAAYNSKRWFRLWRCEFLCQIYLFLNWKQFSVGNGEDVVTCWGIKFLYGLSTDCWILRAENMLKHRLNRRDFLYRHF